VAITAQHRAVVARFRTLVEEAGLEPPDEIEYGHVTVWFLWHERKLCVAVDLTNAPPEYASAGSAG
jgi:hypothetical protein